MCDLGYKILKNIIKAINDDCEIDEYDFLPVLKPALNKNPVLLENHKLGIELWAIKFAFGHAYEKFMKWKDKWQKLTLYDAPDLMQWTAVILLVVPDCMTAWNTRRDLIEQSYTSEDEDLRLSELVISKHHKSPETFYHRKWLLTRVFAKRQNVSDDWHCNLDNDAVSRTEEKPKEENGIRNTVGDPPSKSRRGDGHVLASEMRALVEHELEVCQLACEKYASNYHGWTHRLWLLQRASDAQLLRSQLTWSRDFLTRHVSDHSCYHFRQYLLDTLLRRRLLEKACSVLREEILMMHDLDIAFPGHEANWCHRRFLINAHKHDVVECTCSAPSNAEIGGSPYRPHEETSSTPGYDATADHFVTKKLKAHDGSHQSEAELESLERDFCRGVLEGKRNGYFDSGVKSETWSQTLARRQLRWLEYSRDPHSLSGGEGPQSTLN